MLLRFSVSFFLSNCSPFFPSETQPLVHEIKGQPCMLYLTSFSPPQYLPKSNQWRNQSSPQMKLREDLRGRVCAIKTQTIRPHGLSATLHPTIYSSFPAVVPFHPLHIYPWHWCDASPLMSSPFELGRCQMVGLDNATDTWNREG